MQRVASRAPDLRQQDRNWRAAGGGGGDWECLIFSGRDPFAKQGGGGGGGADAGFEQEGSQGRS